MYVIDSEGKRSLRWTLITGSMEMFVTSGGQVVVMYYNDQYDMEIAPG